MNLRCLSWTPGGRRLLEGEFTLWDGVSFSIAMQHETKTKMHVDQIRRVLQIEGTARQIEAVKKRVGALLERVSNDNDDRGPSMGGFGGY